MSTLGTQCASTTAEDKFGPMQTTDNHSPAQTSPVEAARVAIWRLFQEGYVDEDMATASLLAVDIGTRRTRQSRVPQHRWPGSGPQRSRRRAAA
jgi:hypothetical protein